MNTLGFIIWSVFIFIMGGNVSFWLMYSPKAKIRNRWKIIKKLKIFTTMEEKHPEGGDSAERRVEKFGTQINSILEEDFNPEIDREYIEKNRWVKGKWVT